MGVVGVCVCVCGGGGTEVDLVGVDSSVVMVFPVYCGSNGKKEKRKRFLVLVGAGMRDVNTSVVFTDEVFVAGMFPVSWFPIRVVHNLLNCESPSVSV